LNAWKILLGGSLRFFLHLYSIIVGDMNNDFEILQIDYSGSLIINSTSLKAMSCNGTDDAFVLFVLPPDGPFTISSVKKICGKWLLSNRFFYSQ
ncbi:hypothetical protein KI387_042573, partial [Taxus chinensis]